MILIARRPLYGGKVAIGDPFEVPDQDAPTWVLVGIAAYPDPQAPTSQPSTPSPRRRYQRRDLRAES